MDIPNQRVAVEPGAINAFVTQQVAPYGYFYAPDPSSQQVCSIGGNVAENSGGAHCLKYGFTTTHVLGLDVVLPDGELVHLGAHARRARLRSGRRFCRLGGHAGRGHARLFCASSSARRCMTTLLAAFNSTNEAGEAVSEVIASGVLPAAIEMMDNLAIQAAEAAVHAGYPNCGGLLLVELDGTGDRGRDPDAPGERNLHSAAAPGRYGWRIRKPSAWWCGRAAKPPSPPWDAFRPTTSCRTESFPAPRCRK